MAMSFRTKLLASHVGLVVAVGLIAIFTLNRWLTADLVRQLDARQLEQAKGAIEWAEEGGRRHPDKVATRIAHIVDAEVTLLDRDGTVIGASPAEARTDIGDEIRDARAQGAGKATRMRNGKEMHYVAVPGADGIVVRLGIPLSDVSETVAAMRSRLLVTSAVAIVMPEALSFTLESLPLPQSPCPSANQTRAPFTCLTGAPPCQRTASRRGLNHFTP